LDKKPRKIQPQSSVAARLSDPHRRILVLLSTATPQEKIEEES
jgi:hypothetical protein